MLTRDKLDKFNYKKRRKNRKVVVNIVIIKTILAFYDRKLTTLQS